MEHVKKDVDCGGADKGGMGHGDPRPATLGPELFSTRSGNLFQLFSRDWIDGSLIGMC